jgi:RNA polymerase sigma-70 factor (ECF subfamily)
MVPVHMHYNTHGGFRKIGIFFRILSEFSERRPKHPINLKPFSPSHVITNSVSEKSDADLIRLAQQGEVEAVGAIYDRYHEAVFKFVWLRVRNKQLAEDLTGEVFMRMIIHLPAYHERGAPFAAWLYRVARNLIADHWRKQGGRLSEEAALAESRYQVTVNPAAIVENRLEIERIGRALRYLDDAQQEVIILRFVLGLSLLEVAGVVGRKVATVKTLQHRGLKALRLALQQE